MTLTTQSHPTYNNSMVDLHYQSNRKELLKNFSPSLIAKTSTSLESLIVTDHKKTNFIELAVMISSSYFPS